MNRRAFVRAAVAGLLAAPLAAEAQRRRVPRLGVLSVLAAPGSDPYSVAFLDELRALGHVDGRTIAIESRWAEGHPDRLPPLAAELVRLPVDVIVTMGGPLGARVAQRATSTIPIVWMIMNDPVAQGLVANLARPGGNLTGPAFQDAELGVKQLELLRQTVPRLSRVTVIWNAVGARVPVVRAVEDSAQALGLRLQVQEVRELPDLDRALAAAKKWGAQALLELPSPFFHQNRKALAALLATHQLPAICETRAFVDDGCLMSYGASFPAMSRRAAYYVDRILKGAKPADLPVEQPREFDFIVNSGTAQTLGLTLPPSLLLQATEMLQ